MRNGLYRSHRRLPGTILTRLGSSRCAAPRFALLIIAFVAGSAHADGPIQRYQHEWSRQFGTTAGERAYDIATYGSAVYVAGQIDRGSFAGQNNVGAADGFVRVYSTGGAEASTFQFGTAGSDLPTGIAVDGSGVYLAGSTTGMFSGHTNAGGVDMFVCKYDHAMQPQWTFMTGSSGDDEASAVTIANDGIYVVGWTSDALPTQSPLGSSDAYVIKLDSSGNVMWVRQFGTVGYDQARDVAVDPTGVYVIGRAGEALPGQIHLGSSDVFVRKYDTDGNELWTEQFGTAAGDIGYGICAHASGVYVTGKVSAALPGEIHHGGSDGFVRKYDGDGFEVWTHQFGTFGMDDAFDIATDGLRIYIVGNTSGALWPKPAFGAGDAFLRYLDLDGSELWTTQMGSDRRDDAYAVTTGTSEAYVAGFTSGAIPLSTSAGSIDAFVVRAGEPVLSAELPERVTLYPAFPNPFNPSTRISYTLAEPMPVRIAVYDVRGHRVDTLAERTDAAGDHAVQWDAAGLASGTYFVRFEAGGTLASQRVVLLK